MIEKLHRTVAAAMFVIAVVLYSKTMAPTVSFWDTGEFIATSTIMGVPHPPGSPLYLLLGRIAAMIPIGDIGARVNFISVLSSALAVMFLYLIVAQLLRKWRGPVETRNRAMVDYGSAAIAALTFMVSDSHWFNAVEAEVYAVSTFLTAFVAWLILRWSQRDQDGSHLHYILFIVYILGLASGVHLLNLLALPFIALVIFIRRKEFTLSGLLVTAGITGLVFVFIYLGVIKGYPRMAQASGVSVVVIVTLAILGYTLYVVRTRQRGASIILSAIVLILVGYSTYATIFIRSGQNPAIDENNPDNTRRALAYLEREQYGDWSILDRTRWTPATQNRYTGASDFFWSYQIKKMYARYFLWQFAGRGGSGEDGVSPFGAHANQDGVSWWQFGLPLALLFGLYGIWYHFKNDWPHALAVLSLFVVTGLLIIIYLNQADPQPRERDYAFVGSYFAFAIWIGIGLAGVIDFIQSKLEKINGGRIAIPVLMGAILLAMPVKMLSANYHTHDRTGNYVAWDYAYNLLNSCAPNGIIFTNGDNDTFPLWYVQEVAGIRKDVRVVNLSLLNTDWYIQQLKDHEPKLPLTLSDSEIAQIRPVQWAAQTVSLPLPHPDHPDAVLAWNLKPTYGDRYLRVQDRMVVQIIRDIKWRQPIYFAVTVAPASRLGLEAYLDMQGLVYEVKPTKGATINLDQLEKNLLEVYRYRGLNDPNVHFNSNIQRLLQNVRASYLQLALESLAVDDLDRTTRVMAALAKNIPESNFPVRYKPLYRQMTLLYSEAGDTSRVRDRIINYSDEFDLTPADSVELALEYGNLLKDWATSDSIQESVFANHSFDGRLVSRLIEINAQAGRQDRARHYIKGWMTLHPGDTRAAAMLDSLENFGR